MFANSTNVNISGGYFQSICSPKVLETGVEILQKSIAPGAFHNSAERYDPPKCLAHTRESILEEIMDWIKNKDRKTRFLWLYGPAGAGKSAIEQTIAELCYKAGFLAASFFFSRDSAGRNEKTFFITTIVNQLIVSIPEIREHVGNALYNDHSLPSWSLEAQMEALIVKPLEAALSSSSDGDNFMHPRPAVIVLDGLDECGDPESQRYILKVLMNSVKDHSIPFSFILASRPEQHIREAFDGSLLNSLTTRLALEDSDKYHPDNDIRTFLHSKFKDIRDRHPSGAYLSNPWPSDEVIETLIRKSSGQFIYPSTVIKFVDSHQHCPQDRLNVILGLSPHEQTTPFAEMDSLYLHILASASTNIEMAKEIFTLLLFLPGHNLHLTPGFVESFLLLREGRVFTILSDLHSIVAVPSSHNTALRFFHASLGDFLTDQSRSGDAFYLDCGVSHRKIAKRIINELKNPASALGISEKKALQAILPDHCLKATPDPGFLFDLYHFDDVMTVCAHRPWVTKTSHITQIFTETLDPINASSRVPEFLVWMQGQRHPDWDEDLFTHHLPSIDMWLRQEFSAIHVQDHRTLTINRHFLTSATLVDFLQFRDIHHLIPRVLDLRPKHTTERYQGQIGDERNWEIYLKYRRIVSEFLTNQARSDRLFVGQDRYDRLARYLFFFLLHDLEETERYDAEIPKTVLLILPVILSKATPSDELRLFLARPFCAGPQLRRLFPEVHWEELFSSSYRACHIAMRREWIQGPPVEERRGAGVPLVAATPETACHLVDEENWDLLSSSHQAHDIDMGSGERIRVRLAKIRGGGVPVGMSPRLGLNSLDITAKKLKRLFKS